MSFLGIRSVTVRYGLIHFNSPVTRCHHHRQGSAPSFSNSSQTGGGGGSGVCTLLEDVDEPLLDELPLDDELPDDDEEDDVVLSSSLSTSRFLRGLSLTPPRRGLSLMPRLSICAYWVFMCWRPWSWGMVLGLPRAALGGEPRAVVVAGQHCDLAALGLVQGLADSRVSRGLPSARAPFTDSSAVRTASVSARFGLEGLASVEGLKFCCPNLLRNTH